jgi:Uma2 family endonuclease
MSAVLESPPHSGRHAPAEYDPNEPFGGIGMLRRFTQKEFKTLIELNILEEDGDHELVDGLIVQPWHGDPEKPFGGMDAIRRFGTLQYHTLIDHGVFTDDERLELLDGYLVRKMSHTPEHDFSSDALEDLLRKLIPSEMFLRVQKSITLENSEPEPDIAVVRGPRTRYRNAHPATGDIHLVVEVAYSSLPTDRRDKARIYAEAALPEYWVVNVGERQIEVFSKPENGRYTETIVYPITAYVPLNLESKRYGEIPVHTLF